MLRYYDLHLRSNLSDGESSIADIIKFAEKLGYSGICILETPEKLKMLTEGVKLAQPNIEVIPGVLVIAKDANEMRNIVKKVRNEVVIVAVQGGDYDVNRAACEDPRVDILSTPELGRIDNGLDDVCAKEAARNNVAIEINFSQALNTHRKIRSHVLNHLARNIFLCENFKAPIIITSGAKSVWNMRDPRELVALTNVLGMDLGKTFSSLSEIPHLIIENNKKKLEGKMFRGVEAVE